MAITTISFLSILNDSIENPKPYVDFRTRNTAFIFKAPANVTLLGVNGFDVTNANFTTLPAISVIPDIDDADRCTLNWTKLNSLWSIPTGAYPYIGKFTYLSNQYYSIFGSFTADGNVNTNIGAGKEITVTLDPGVTNPVIFTHVHIESLPYSQPCNIVRNYHDTTGIVSISLT